jgi:hypothetical protein
VCAQHAGRLLRAAEEVRRPHSLAVEKSGPGFRWALSSLGIRSAADASRIVRSPVSICIALRRHVQDASARATAATPSQRILTLALPPRKDGQTALAQHGAKLLARSVVLRVTVLQATEVRGLVSVPRIGSRAATAMAAII